MSTNSNPYTIETISRMRAEKKEELKQSKVKMQRLAQNLFSPPETKNKMDLMMHHFNTGMAAYDGIMTGIKIYRRIKGMFKKRK